MQDAQHCTSSVDAYLNMYNTSFACLSCCGFSLYNLFMEPRGNPAVQGPHRIMEHNDPLTQSSSNCHHSFI
ncbi:hypothetical protein BDZ91DRAFT_718377 [Kalaharituber pfeilii]|nr:hypothetical protein BDZ91DRAFT_718377 [Kalaharituber pfeilii]